MLSLLFGTFLAALRVGPVGVLRTAAGVYVAVVRNTPLLIVLIFFRIAGPKIGIQFNWVDIVWGEIRMTAFFSAAAVALTVYTSAFVCEAIRSGDQRSPCGSGGGGSRHRAAVLRVMRNVVLPQALRASVPPLASVQIALLKNTTVTGVFGVIEAFYRMRLFTNDFATERIGIFLGFALIFVVLVELRLFRC